MEFKQIANKMKEHFDKMAKGKLLVVADNKGDKIMKKVVVLSHRLLDLEDVKIKEDDSLTYIDYEVMETVKVAANDYFIEDREKTLSFRDKIFDIYLSGFDDPIERQSENCTNCRKFFKNYGNVITVINGEVVTLFDIKTDDYYKKSFELCAEYIKSCDLDTVFLCSESIGGVQSNTSLVKQKTFNHFFINIPEKYKSTEIGKVKSENRGIIQVYEKGLSQIRVDIIDEVLGLIARQEIYNAAQFLKPIQEFKDEIISYKASSNKSIYIMDNLAYSLDPKNLYSKSKFAAINVGQWIHSMSVKVAKGEEIDWNAEIRGFGSTMHGYKQPTTLIQDPNKIKKNQKLIEELGFMPWLTRRLAIESDISVVNTLYTNRKTAKILSPFDLLATKPIASVSAQEVKIEEFITNVLPTAEKVEILFDAEIQNNLVTLVTGELSTSGESMFIYDNPFSLDYRNNAADAIKQAVKDAGGEIHCVLRFSLSWNDPVGIDRSTDFDLWVQEPSGAQIYWRQYKRTNKLDSNSAKSPNGGNLDLDNTFPGSSIGLENITYKFDSLFKNGDFVCRVNNFSGKTSGGGFTVQVEFNDTKYNFVYDKALGSKQFVDVVSVGYKNGEYTLKPVIAVSNVITTKNIWNLDTNKFHEVENIILSPNYWNTQQGNKHYMFLINNCRTNEPVKPWHGEFITNKLKDARVTMNLLAEQMKINPSSDQISGFGFSETVKRTITLKINNRPLKVKTNY